MMSMLNQFINCPEEEMMIVNLKQEVNFQKVQDLETG